MLRFSLSLKLRFSCTKSQTYYLLQFFLLDLRPCNPKVEKKKKKQILAERLNVYPCFWKAQMDKFQVSCQILFFKRFEILTYASNI